MQYFLMMMLNMLTAVQDTYKMTNEGKMTQFLLKLQ